MVLITLFNDGYKRKYTSFFLSCARSKLRKFRSEIYKKTAAHKWAAAGVTLLCDYVAIGSFPLSIL